MITGVNHPSIAPTFLCWPPRVRGMPVRWAILDFRPEMPKALRHDHDNPHFLPIFPPHVSNITRSYAMNRRIGSFLKLFLVRLSAHREDE
jgi:hypothetical protein